jgi:hypothetical protein
MQLKMQVINYTGHSRSNLDHCGVKSTGTDDLND